MALILNGFDSEPGSNDEIPVFESGSGRVSDRRDFADAFDVRSIQTVPNFQGTEPVDTSSFDAVATADVVEDAATPAVREPSLIDRLRKILGNVVDSVATTATAAAQGAVEGATAASQGASTGAQIGARATTVQTQINTTTLLLGAVALILLLRR